MYCWDIYKETRARSIYQELLLSEGMSPAQARGVMQKFNYLISRLTEYVEAEGLYVCGKDDFLGELRKVVEERLKRRLIEKYVPTIDHLFKFFEYIPIYEAITGEYVNDDERNRIENAELEFPATSLTDAEGEYVREGKLTALVNAPLIAILRKKMQEATGATEARAVCRLYYRFVLPAMKAGDFRVLLEKYWTLDKKVRMAKDRQFVITMPDGTELVQSTFDGLKTAICFYGEKEVMKLDLLMRDHPLVTNRLLQSDMYVDIGNGYFVNKKGSYKDRLKALRMLNYRMGNKLKIEEK